MSRSPVKLKVVDAHAHLEELEDLEAKLTKAFNLGVVAVVTAGSDLESSVFALEVGRRVERLGVKVYGAVGLHPWSLKELSPGGVEEVLRFVEAKAKEAVAVGEIGLDYWLPEARKEGAGRELQRKVFARQLRAAKDAGKPVVVHSRGAWRDCLDMVKEAGVEALFHWFSGPLDVLKDLLSCGYYVSATPAIDYSEEHINVVKHTPLTKLLVETDSPVKYKGKFNREAEPADVVEVVKMLASMKEVSVEEVAKLTSSNASSLYGIELA
ncbi:MAG: hypothetical protein DRJ97_01365 [Thermoprotei archaeon]|nr:MAG: hypothetical protein DRJ97_01365 [Thermoprotei archaeon]